MKTLLKGKKFHIGFNMALLIILIVLIVIISAIAPGFMKYNYVMNVVIKNIFEIGLLALPMTLIIITGGIDLSVGSILILSAISGGMAAASFGGAAGVFVTMAVGLLCGLANGLVIVKLKISPLVTTLATFFFFRGIAKGMTHGDSV